MKTHAKVLLVSPVDIKETPHCFKKSGKDDSHGINKQNNRAPNGF